MTAYLVTLRHTDRLRIPALCSFSVSARNWEQAAILASDRYRLEFGAPSRGTTEGIPWVHLDFTVVSCEECQA